jgi:hypothetical protein
MALRRIGSDWGMRVGAFVSIVAAVAALVTGLSAAPDDVIAYRVTGRLNLVDGRNLFKPNSIAIELRVVPDRPYVVGTENSRAWG